MYVRYGTSLFELCSEIRKTLRISTLRHIFFGIEEENEMEIFSRLIFSVRTVSNQP